VGAGGKIGRGAAGAGFGAGFGTATAAGFFAGLAADLRNAFFLIGFRLTPLKAIFLEVTFFLDRFTFLLALRRLPTEIERLPREEAARVLALVFFISRPPPSYLFISLWRTTNHVVRFSQSPQGSAEPDSDQEPHEETCPA
jgi:hypothetical protein